MPAYTTTSGFRVAGERANYRISAVCGSAIPLYLRVFFPAVCAFLCGLLGVSALSFDLLFGSHIVLLVGHNLMLYAGILFAACIFLVFGMAHGVSMVVGRRRPRKYVPATISLNHPMALRKKGTYKGIIMSIINDLEELSKNSEVPGITKVQTINTKDSKEAHQSMTQDRTYDVCFAARCVFAFWHLIFTITIHLPFRCYWDSGGLDEALLRCPAYTFVLPSWFQYQHIGADLKLLSMKSKAKFEPLMRDLCVYRILPSGCCDKRKTKAFVYVGYRGIFFDNQRIFLDRKTSISSLNELMCWRREISYVEADQDNRKDSLWVAAEGGACSMAFPIGVKREGRHPRHSDAASMSPSKCTPSLFNSNNVVHIPSLATAIQLHNGYYHWVTERLSALCLFLDILKGNPDTKLLIDFRFHGSERDNPWCVQFLRILGIKSSQIVRYNPCKVYCCDELFVTTPIEAYATDPRLLTLVRNRIFATLPKMPKLHAPALYTLRGSHSRSSPFIRILIITRKSAKARKCIIWNTVHDMLLCETSRRNINCKVQKLDLALMTVSDQIKTFRNANVILGVHGAGFANILWCRPGTHVCEIVPVNPPPIRYLFWHLAACLGLKYHAFPVMNASWNDSIIDGINGRSIAMWVMSKSILPKVM